MSPKGKLLMRLKHLWNEGKRWLVCGLQAVEGRMKTWTEPAPDRAIKGVVPATLVIQGEIRIGVV
jgi:hypothetical protein